MPKLIKPTREGPPLESDVMREVRKWLAEQPDIRVWRNNTGALKDERGRVVTYGLAVGSADLIGSITCDVGLTHAPTYPAINHKIARFLAIELKQPGKKPTEDQERFLETVRRDGGVAFWADCIGEVMAMIGLAREWKI